MSAPQPCERFMDFWKVGEGIHGYVKTPPGAVCPRCGFYREEHPASPSVEQAKTPAMADDLEHALSSALNRYSAENPSNTPDWILAQFLLGCLAAWNQGVQQRETWYGLDARPSALRAEQGTDTP